MADASGGPFSLAGRTALVTGSTRGIGRAIARAFAEAGAHVAVNGRDDASVAAAVADLTGDGLDASAAPFDVTDPEATTAAVDTLAQRQGGLDIAVANAGTTLRTSLAELTPEALRGQMVLNLDACFYLARAAAPHMATDAVRARGGGRIVFTASVMSDVARANIPAYVASKAGVRGLAKALGVELAPDGITCNALAPGFVLTDLTQPLKDDAAFDAWVTGRVPLGRWGRPEEVAHAAVYLASPAAAYVTGQTLTIDGGMTVNA